jgi:hypothetical protein
MGEQEGDRCCMSFVTVLCLNTKPPMPMRARARPASPKAVARSRRDSREAPTKTRSTNKRIRAFLPTSTPPFRKGVTFVVKHKCDDHVFFV